MASIHLPIGDEYRGYGINDILIQNNILRVKIIDDINNIPEQDLLIQLPQSINKWDKFIEGIVSYTTTELTESYKDKAADETALELISSAIRTIIENNRDLIFPQNKNKNEYENENESSSNETQQEEPQFLKLGEIIKEPEGIFITEGEVYSDSESIYHAVIGVDFCCKNENCESVGRTQTQSFEPPLCKLRKIPVQCKYCGKLQILDYVDLESIPRDKKINFVIIEIQDPIAIESTNRSPRLPVIVYGKDIDKINIGNRYRIEGKICIPAKAYQNPLSSKGELKGNMFSIMHTYSLSNYTEKTEYDFNITDKDIEIIIRWKKICEDAYQKQIKHNKTIELEYCLARDENPDLTIEEFSNKTFRRPVKELKFIDCFRNMFGTKIVGNEDAKLDILLTAVSDLDKESILHCIFAGPPGPAKSTLAKEGLKLAKRSRFVSAETSTLKAVVAITDKSHDIRKIIYGPIILVQDGIVCLDEFGSFPLEQQSQILEVLSDGRFSLNRFGIERDIRTPCKLLLTTNPFGDRADWSVKNKISRSELPLTRPVLDRVPLIRNFKSDDNFKEAAEYAREKFRLSKLKEPRYQFLIKAIGVMHKLNKNIRFTKEAEDIIIQLYAQLTSDPGAEATRRTFEVIRKIAKAQTKVNLYDEVTGETMSGEIQDYLTELFSQYNVVVKKVINPHTVAVNSIVNYIKKYSETNTNTNTQIVLIDAIKEVQKADKRIDTYIGHNYDQSHNKTLRHVIEDVLLSRGIVKCKPKPITVYYSEQSTATTNNTSSRD